MNWTEKTVLVTGGTGSFGRTFVRTMLRDHPPRRLIVFSRDELKQHEMQAHGFEHDCMRYFIGDVRDVDRLKRAMTGVNVVIHAAALKQVPACEYNPIEAVLTNVMGARNVIDAAIDSGVEKVMALSTDKAASPINLYGATKLVAEKLFVHANAYSGGQGTSFSCVRYGNVVGSRGSVVPTFLKQKKSGKVTVTDSRMTRFWITIEEGVRFVIESCAEMRGGEIFVPKIPSMSVMDLATLLAPKCEVEIVGIRPGEKLHEILIGPDEARHTVELKNKFIIRPPRPWQPSPERPGARRLPDDFRYGSDNNPQTFSRDDLQRLIRDLGVES